MSYIFFLQKILLILRPKRGLITQSQERRVESYQNIKKFRTGNENISLRYTVCPRRSDPPEKILYTFA